MQTLSASSFPPDLQNMLATAYSHTKGEVSVDQLELAMRWQMHFDEGRVPIWGFPLKLQSKMQVLEPDADQCVRIERIEEALAALVDEKEQERASTLFWASLTLASIMMVASVVALLSLVVDMQRGVDIVNGRLVSRATGLPMQTANTDLAVVNGVATSRRSLDGGPVPVATAPFWSAQNLSSNMTVAELSGVPSLTLRVPGSNGLVWLGVNGFALVPGKDGRLVLFNTELGTFVLSGTRLFPADGPYGEYAGLGLADLVDTAQGRRADPVKYDALTGMDAQGNCVWCLVCSCGL